ncbi:MAG: ABC transporter permease subunit [Eubacteriales bacterium]|nr:ABC transporter permease subunit [Eubacteriales bacterium]
MSKKRWFLERAASILILLGIWQAAAMALDQRILLVTPLVVFERLFCLLFQGSFWKTVLYSFVRIEAGLFLGLFLGSILAMLASRFHVLEVLFWPVLVMVKTIPVASFIIIALIWLRAEKLSVFISFLMVLPVVYFNVLQGMKSTDQKLLEAAEVFRMPHKRRLLYIYLPALRPFLLSACMTALGISWKAGIAAEIIGVPDGSIGEMLYEAKIYLNTGDLFAWTLVIVLISVLFEKFFLWFLKKVLNRLEQI